MGSYAAFYLAGMYPVPATRQILLSSPYFPEISFYNPTFDKTTTIKANGFQGNPVNGEGGSVFVKVTLNAYSPLLINLTHYRARRVSPSTGSHGSRIVISTGMSLHRGPR